MKEMEGKLRLTSSKIAARLAATAAAGLKAPRLEEMRNRLALDAFEVNVVVYLAGVTISPTIKSIIEDRTSYENRQATTGIGPFSRVSAFTVAPSSISPLNTPPFAVNDLLTAFCDTFNSQIARRTCFYKRSSLVKHGIIKVTPTSWSHSTCRLLLHYVFVTV